ncbi:MAG: hypothetical protein NT047_08860 [Deltaproteobacteria bacterium]|nr:hypothetical protein [Deltaproteobacteria bacterium]
MSVSHQPGERKAALPGFLASPCLVLQSPLTKVKGARDLMLTETTHNGKTYRIERPPTVREMEDLLFGWFVKQGETMVLTGQRAFKH